jgi:hypothetical protein
MYDALEVSASFVGDTNTAFRFGDDTERMPVAGAVYGDYTINTNATLFDGSNNWWRAVGLDQTNAFKYSCEGWTTNGGVYASQYVRSNNLIEVKTVLQELSDIVAVIDYTELSVSNSTRYKFGGTTNAFDSTTAGVYAKSDVVTGANNLLATSTGTDSAGADNEHFSISVLGTVQSFVSATPANDNSSLSVDVLGYARINEGCSLPYPSDWAITNGYVNGYDVYAVWVCQHGARLRGGVNSTIDAIAEPVSYTNLVSYTDDPTQPAYYESYLFNVCSNVRNRASVTIGTDTVLTTQAAGNTNTYNAVFLSASDYYQSTRDYTNALLSHVAYVPCTNAVSVPTFDIVAPTNAVSLLLADYQQHNMIYDKASGRFTVDQMKFETALAIQKFVIVARMAWTHENKVNPYSPTPYTPDWMTNNTNSLAFFD